MAGRKLTPLSGFLSAWSRTILHLSGLCVRRSRIVIFFTHNCYVWILHDLGASETLCVDYKGLSFTPLQSTDCGPERGEVALPGRRWISAPACGRMMRFARASRPARESGGARTPGRLGKDRWKRGPETENRREKKKTRDGRVLFVLPSPVCAGEGVDAREIGGVGGTEVMGRLSAPVQIALSHNEVCAARPFLPD
jgi:hypothetical protein